jgi:Leucine-rich repeat (LRR) protein
MWVIALFAKMVIHRPDSKTCHGQRGDKRMSCNGKSNKVGVVIDYSPTMIAVAHHGCADAVVSGTKYRFSDTEAVINGLRDRRLPPEVRHELLRNLAINRVSLRRMPRSLTEDEKAQYRRLVDTVRLLRWSDIDPATPPAEVKELDLRWWDRKALPDAIGDFVNLRSLRANDTDIVNVSDELWGLQRLRYLNLEGSKIKELSSRIGAMASLDSLNIGSLRIKAFPPEIGNLVGLTKLDISGNDFTEFPPEVLKLSNLTHLDIGFSYFETLPEDMGKLAKLQVLSMRWMKNMQHFPESIGRLTNLRAIDASLNSMFHTLPASIGNLRKLRTLNLSLCEIETLPPEIGELTALQILDLGFSGLETLPPEIGQLVELREVDLFGSTRLRRIPPEVARLTNLRKLNIVAEWGIEIPPEVMAMREHGTIIERAEDRYPRDDDTDSGEPEA